MSVTLLWVYLVGALLELDTTYAFQLTFSRGILAGPLLGLITGDVMIGLQVGIFTELLFIDISPLGGLLPPSSAICCTVSMALCTFGIPVYFSFFIGTLSAILFSLLELFIRRHRIDRIAVQEQKIIQNPSYLTWAILESLIFVFIGTLLFVWIVSTITGSLLIRILPALPEQIHIASRFAYMAVPWIGMAALIPLFRLKRR